MRITNKMVTNRYIRSLGTLSSDLDRLNTQVSSGRKFLKSSENTSAAIRAYKIRRDMSKVEGYQANIDHAKDFLSNSESALFHIQELMHTARDKILIPLNGTASQDERNIVATELRNIQDQLVQTLNSNVSDVFLFGGTNTDTRPFEVVDGKLVYNGSDLDVNLDLSTVESGSDEEEAMIALIDKFNGLTKDSRYIDIGLNLSFDPATGNTGSVDKSTVFCYSVPGINITGYGTTEIDGKKVSDNLYNLLGEIVTELESDNHSHDNLNSLFGHFTSVSSNILSNITGIGSKTSYLEFMTERIETRTLNLQESQLNTEGADPVKSIIHFKSQEMAYNAALQMGTRIIQPSIFDFMS
jgi:flagellar hook-associated protein 3 FlgL